MIDYDFVGVDIAKNKFDAAFKHRNGKFIENIFENNIEGYQLFILWLNEHKSKILYVCFESTGPYGEPLAEFLVMHDIAVSMVNPMQIKHHAKSLLSRNKNDRVDARIIASYAEKFRPRLFSPKSKEQKFIRESVELIDMLNEQKNQLNNQLESIRSKEIQHEIDKIVASIEKRILKIEKQLNAAITANKKYYVTKQRLLSIVGVGEKTANCVIAYFPDINEFKNAKQLAAYVGLSPKQYQSGKHHGQTKISKCGNSQIRKAFYMPAIVAKNHNPHLKAFCLRLEKNGLKPKQIICAVMRKLIHIIFGMLKNEQNFNPKMV